MVSTTQYTKPCGSIPILPATNVPPCASVSANWTKVPLLMQRIASSSQSSSRSISSSISSLPTGVLTTSLYVQPTASSSQLTSTTRGHHCGWRLMSAISSQTTFSGASIQTCCRESDI